MIKVVFENEDFCVVDKPAGLSFHQESAADGEKVPGLVQVCQSQWPQATLFPVHRLDKMTSGLVIFALNKATAQAFQTLFEQHHVEKYYVAISDAKPKKKQGWVKGDMVPARRGNWKLMPTKQNPAITRFVSQSTQPNERWFLLKPTTGKTHQLRVAMKSLGAPIMGDARYHASVQVQEMRGYLHAYALRFQLREVFYEFVCPPSFGERFLSDAAQEMLVQWSKPWQVFEPLTTPSSAQKA